MSQPIKGRSTNIRSKSFPFYPTIKDDSIFDALDGFEEELEVLKKYDPFTPFYNTM